MAEHFDPTNMTSMQKYEIKKDAKVNALLLSNNMLTKVLDVKEKEENKKEKGSNKFTSGQR